MNKKFLPAILMFATSIAFFACKKSNNSANGNSDATRQYFPIQKGKHVVYNVDSTVYADSNCTIHTRHCQIMYTIADTFRDANDSLSYLMNVSYRPDQDSLWQKQGVLYVTPTARDIEVSNSNVKFVKLVFPVIDGEKWKGNSFIGINDSANFYYGDWNYTYMNYGQSYNNGVINFGNTLTVLEDDEAKYSTEFATDGAINYRTYAKEVYGYGVGMVYSEWTHWEVTQSSTCKKGYSVVMRAVEYN
jgi:hypothetical protein